MTRLEGPGPGARVVVVEADPALRARLVGALQARGFDAIQVGDLPALLGRLDPPEGEHASFAVVWRPGGARVASAATPLQVLAEARLLLLTASSGGPLPEHVTPASERVERLRTQAAAARASASPRFDELLGVSAPMVELVGLLGQVAASDVSVLITSETGTGKASIRTARAEAAPDDPGSLVSLAELELTHMRRVLHAVGGNKTLAARILGCDRRTLYRKLVPEAGPDAPGSH